MSWLAPLFLIGLGAVALPIWLHRLQTETPKRLPFSSAMLLKPAERRVHVQKRLRYWLLLALRILLLCLLAFAFAKPVWIEPPKVLSAAQAKLHVLLMDSSMSMQAGDKWMRAQAEANRIIDSLNAADRIEVIAAGDALETVMGPVNASGEGKDGARRALEKLRPHASQLKYGAMMAGLDGLLANETQATVAHVISDFQRSALPAQFGDLVPRAVNGRATEVTLHTIGKQPDANFAVAAIERSGMGVNVIVRGFNTAEQSLKLQLIINGVVKAEQTKVIPAAANGPVSTTWQFDKVPLNVGSNKVEAHLLSGDALSADDVYYAVLDYNAGQPVPLLSSNPGALPAKYLTAAFAAAGDRFKLEPAKIDQFDTRSLARYRFVVIDDIGALTDKLTAALNDYIKQGGAVFAATGERTLTLRQLPLVNLTVAATRTDAPLIGNIDLNHPALSRSAGFRGLTITRYVPLSLNNDSHVLIRLDNGAPLLLEQRIGQGRVLLLTSSLDNTWNDLPVQPVFVSFLSEAARYLSGETLLNRSLHVGGNLALEQAASAGQIIDPHGKNLLSLSDSQRARTVKLDEQGFYEVVTASGSSLVAVNAIADESDLTPMSDEEFKNWQQSLLREQQSVVATAAQEAKPSNNGLELWHWLLIALAIAVLAESLLGNTYLSRRVETPS